MPTAFRDNEKEEDEKENEEVSDLMWVLRCDKHSILERGIKKSELLRLYKKHVKDGCLEVKEVFAERLDQRFSF